MQQITCAKCDKVATMQDIHVLPEGWEDSMGDNYCGDCLAVTKVALARAIKPLYRHDCDVCVYLGRDERYEGEPQCNGVDLYVCKSILEHDCLIRRYSSEDSNYGAMDESYAGERYAEVKRRVKAARILKMLPWTK